MDKDFWLSRYNTDDSIPTDPSMFAQHCWEQRWVNRRDRLLELGHGNGRDALWFAERGIYVTGVDQAERRWRLEPDMYYLGRGDFTDQNHVEDATVKVKSSVVYSRWTWHSITEEDEDKLLSWLPEQMTQGGSLLIECRTVEDDIFGAGREVARNTYLHQGHRRRFIQPEELIGKLKRAGFNPVTSKVGRGFSPCGGSDPVLLRLRAHLG